MKKIMTALAGVLTVMLLASCQKEVEIDGDVSFEKDSSKYLYAVACTASEKYETYSDGTWTHVESRDKTLKADIAIIDWTRQNSNQSVYSIEMNYTGETKEKEQVWGWCTLIEYKGEYYLDEVKPTMKVTVSGNPKGSEFTVSSPSEGSWQNVERKDTKPVGRTSRDFKLTFTRK